MDADLQDNPEEIPELYALIMKGIDATLVAKENSVKYSTLKKSDNDIFLMFFFVFMSLNYFLTPLLLLILLIS